MAITSVMERAANLVPADVIPTQAQRDTYVADRNELYDPAVVLANKLEHGKTSIPYPGY